MLDDFFIRALLAGIGIALVTGPLGCFIIWRRLSFFGDTLEILLNINLPPTVKLDFDYVVFNQDEKKIATGSTTIAFLDSDSRKPIRCPKEISDKISGV